ncbi:MAG: hypothetical protein R3D67_02115 [Hyphomicrobiaceae bacterium]
MQTTTELKLARTTLAVVMLLATTLPSYAQQAPTTTLPSSVTTERSAYEACLARDENGFRAAVEAITVQTLEQSVKGLDYRPIVAAEWRKGGIDEVIATQVDKALVSIKQETSWSERIASLASKETQEKLATAAAERVYHSDAMKKSIADLAEGVGREIGSRLELASGTAAEQATQCLKEYLGPRFGRMVANAVANDAGQKFAIDAERSKADVTRGSILVEGKEGITGIVVLIMRRQLANLARRVSQRLVGAVLGRVVSAVAGGIGIALIAKDIWDLRNGVLPIIASEMKSTATRDKVQSELAASIATEVKDNLREIAKRTADGVIEVWDQFRRAHAKVLDIAERNADFKKFTNAVSPDRISRLDELVALQLADGGETALMARVADGSLGEAVTRWPAAALEIARDLRSLDMGFQWRALAGDDLLAKVAAYEVHRRTRPQEMTRATLARILSLDDRLAISRLSSLKGKTVEPLLELDAARLKPLARQLDEASLTSLSAYMTALKPKAGHQLLETIARTPSAMQAVQPERVRRAVLESRNQEAALAIVLRREDLFDSVLFVRDVELVRAGEVSPRILLAHYPIALIVFAGIALAVMLIIMRALFGRRPARKSGSGGARTQS